MKVLIHRGSNEIGGTCIQLSTEKSSILLDLGLPLSRESRDFDVSALRPDAVLISHPHQDHFGLIDVLGPEVPVYIGELGKKLIDATRILIGKELHTNNFHHFKSWQPFVVGDFRITPYLVDHSAVDAYGFLIEAEGKRLFYSGDFRAHGRKSVLFDKIVSTPPKDIDLLFMEGTMMQRNNDDFPTEADVERKIFETIKGQENITFLISSSQNIDRIVSAYRACMRAHKTLVIDIYTAWVLEQLKMISNNIPAMEWELIKVYASHNQDEKLTEHPDFFGDFRKRVYRHRVMKDELQSNPADYLFFGKMSHHKIIDLYKSDKPVNVIYSQWLGYLSNPTADYYGSEAMAAYRNDPQVNFVYAHTSGHATVQDLQTFAGALKPKMLVPVHTEFSNKFREIFDLVFEIDDNKEFNLNEKGQEHSMKNETTNKIESRLMQMNKMASELQNQNTSEFAERDRYTRIGGESYRAVSLRDDYPLCGCSVSGSKKLTDIENHFINYENDPKSLNSDVLDTKKERSLQCWIIKHSLINNRDMLIPLKLKNSHFDSLHFALDEVSLGDKKNPVTNIPGIKLKNSSGTTAVRCDILAVGKQHGKCFPVIIELKSNRNMKDLIGQLDNFAELICRFKNEFIPLLETCTGLIINDHLPRKVIIWPYPKQDNSISKKHLDDLNNASISVLEYDIENTDYVFVPFWANV